MFPRRHAHRGQNFIQNFLASVRVTHLDIRTHGSAKQCHFNVYATGSEVNNDEVWLYLCDLTLTSRVYVTKQGQGTTLQLPFVATYVTARITSGAATQLYPGGTDGTSSNQRGGGGSTHGYRTRRRRY